MGQEKPSMWMQLRKHCGCAFDSVVFPNDRTPLGRFLKNWCEALSLQPRPWRALRAVSQLSMQISKKWFFWPFGDSKLLKRGLLAKNTRFYYVSSSEIWLHFENSAQWRVSWELSREKKV